MPPTTGLLTPATRPFSTQKVEVSGSISTFIEYFWIVQWDIPAGQSFTSVNIPFPSAHLVYEPEATGLFGPTKGCFEKVLTGKSFAVGTRFKTGYLYPLIKTQMTQLTDQCLDTNAVMNLSTAALEAQFATFKSHKEIIDLLTNQLELSIEKVDHSLLVKAEQCFNICQQIERNPAIHKVDDIALQAGLSLRTLERLFAIYVGLSPKWVIRLFRLQQVADQLVNQEPINWAELSLSLGYFDQAHCMNDFKTFTGKSASLIRKRNL